MANHYGLNLPKINSKGNFDMPNETPIKKLDSDKKWRFFFIVSILAPFYDQNPKMAISQKRLDQF